MGKVSHVMALAPLEILEEITGPVMVPTAVCSINVNCHMFDNTVNLKKIGSTGTIISPNVTVSLVDTTNGKSIRQDILGGVETKLSVARSNSNENPGFVTDRRVVRIDVTKASSIAGKQVTTSAYIVLSTPRGEFTMLEVGNVLFELLSFLTPAITCISADDDARTDDFVAETSTLSRLLNAEL